MIKNQSNFFELSEESIILKRTKAFIGLYLNLYIS